MSKIFILGKRNLLNNYKNAVQLFNHTPVISERLYRAFFCDALILAGGGDVYPFFYNQPNNLANNKNLKRDICEFALIDHFFKRGLPILGICRGMQILNVYFGGNLMPTIKNHKLHYSPNEDIYHKIYSTIPPFKGEYVTNSAHLQAVEKLAKSFEPLLFSNDKIIEAFSFENAKILGVQYHPERLIIKGLPLGKITFEYFFDFLNK